MMRLLISTLGLTGLLASAHAVAQYSPAPAVPVPVKLEPNPPAYIGVCEVTPTSGDPYTLRFSARGSGGSRVLRFEPNEQKFLKQKINLGEANRIGEFRLTEYFVVGKGKSRLLGSIDWDQRYPGGHLTIMEPIRTNAPVKYVVLTKCQMTIGDGA